MSFWIFFLLLIIVTIEIPVCFGTNCTFTDFEELITINNLISFGGLLLLILGAVFYYEFLHKLEGDLNLPVKIERIENINYEYFALLVTIISLLAFDFSTIRGLVLLIVLVTILGAIFIKTDLFYSNPSFALLGFHIYKADTNNENLKNCVFITKDKVEQGEKVKYLKISNKVYFTKKA
jgi:hypothetical protein